MPAFEIALGVTVTVIEMTTVVTAIASHRLILRHDVDWDCHSKKVE
jgi:hypothetical protein